MFFFALFGYQFFISFQFEWTRIVCRNYILAWFWHHIHLALDEILTNNLPIVCQVCQQLDRTIALNFSLLYIFWHFGTFLVSHLAGKLKIICHVGSGMIVLAGLTRAVFTHRQCIHLPWDPNSIMCLKIAFWNTFSGLKMKKMQN